MDTPGGYVGPILERMFARLWLIAVLLLPALLGPGSLIARGGAGSPADACGPSCCCADVCPCAVSRDEEAPDAPVLPSRGWETERVLALAEETHPVIATDVRYLPIAAAPGRAARPSGVRAQALLCIWLT